MIQSIHFVQRVGLALLIAVASVASCFGAEPVVAPTLQFPKIETYGAVVDLPSAEERPQAGGTLRRGACQDGCRRREPELRTD